MRVAHKSGQDIIVNMERGEEIFSVLIAFLESEKILSAVLAGLGAAGELEIAYYDLETKNFERQRIKEDVEILSLNGNFAYLGEKPVLHIHGVFGRRDLTTFGGHLFACHISGAGEIHIRALPRGKMTRAFDETTGLNLLCSSETS